MNSDKTYISVREKTVNPRQTITVMIIVVREWEELLSKKMLISVKFVSFKRHPEGNERCVRI